MKLPTPMVNGKGFLALGLALALGACGGEPASNTDNPVEEAPERAGPPALDRGARAENEVLLLFLGDSIAAGYGLPADQAFPALLEGRLRAATEGEGKPVRVLNAGVSGDTTAGGLSRLDWLLKQRPDLLVVELGGNDLLRGLPLSETEANLRAILQGAKSKDVDVLLLGMTAPETMGPEAKAAFDALYPRLAEEEGVAFAPAFLSGLIGEHALLQADGLHPTAEGHVLLAEALEPKLLELVRGASPAPG